MPPLPFLLSAFAFVLCLAGYTSSSMPEKTDDLAKAEAILEAQSQARTTSVAKDIKLESDRENALDRTPGITQPFSRAAAGTEHQAAEQQPRQEPSRPEHQPAPGRNDGPKISLPGANSLQQQGFDERQKKLSMLEEAKHLQAREAHETGSGKGNEIESEHGRNDGQTDRSR